MFDIGWSEFFIIGVIALIVIGPKDMPAAMRGVARAIAKVRGLSHEFQSGVAEIMREAELDELKRKINDAGRYDPSRFIKDQVDPSGKLTEDFDPRTFVRAVSESRTTQPPIDPETTPSAGDSPDTRAGNAAGDESIGGDAARERGTPPSAPS